MKALTLWQPWATLVAHGIKQHETRSWWTPYRGPLVIHAAKRPCTTGTLLYDMSKKARDYILSLPDWYFDSDTEVFNLPYGAGVCVADLVSVTRTEDIAPYIDEEDYLFGDYSEGRYAWRLENVRLFETPIPYRGAQGLFNWTGPLP